jgi:hypothetical protein
MVAGMARVVVKVEAVAAVIADRNNWKNGAQAPFLFTVGRHCHI